MLKRTLQAPPQETGAIDGYTAELSRLLRPALPGERADEIVSEAQAHLYDRADAIAADEKLPQAEAEARAVAAFTPAIEFARDMARSAFETAHSKAWRAIGKSVAAGIFCGLFVLLFGSGFGYPSLPQIVSCLLFTVAVCAFQARRSQTRQFVCWGAAAVVFTLLFANFFFLDGAPNVESGMQRNRFSMANAYNTPHSNAVGRERRTVRLQKGAQKGLLHAVLLQQRFAKTAWWYALVTLGFGAWIVTLDWLFAKLGQAVFAKRRARCVQRA